MITAESLARELADIRRQLGGRSAPQLAYSSIEDGGVNEYDRDGAIGSRIGTQFDGSHMAASLNGPTPPTPTAPVVQPVTGGLLVGWDGEYTDAASSPMDFARIEVHVGTASGFDATTAATLAGTIETPRGVSVLVPLPDYAARFVVMATRTLSGKLGARSARKRPAPRCRSAPTTSTST